MKLEQAEPIANKILLELLPYCNKIDIAGSVRRKREYVKDIEIVCVPKTNLSFDVFDFPQINRDRLFIKQVYALGRLVKGNPINGRYVKILVRDEIKIDIFITTPEDYYRIFAIRTGPAEYSHKTIARKWSQMGWVGTPEGLRLKKQIDQEEKPINLILPPAWKSERDFFAWLGIVYLDPEDRF